MEGCISIKILSLLHPVLNELYCFKQVIIIRVQGILAAREGRVHGDELRGVSCKYSKPLTPAYTLQLILNSQISTGSSASVRDKGEGLKDHISNLEARWESYGHDFVYIPHIIDLSHMVPSNYKRG